MSKQKTMFSPKSVFFKKQAAPEPELKRTSPKAANVKSPKANAPFRKMDSKENTDEKFPSGANSPVKSGNLETAKNDFASTLPNLDKRINHGPILEMDLENKSGAKPAIEV